MADSTNRHAFRCFLLPFTVVVWLLAATPSAMAAPGTAISFTASPAGQTVSGLSTTTLSWSSDATNPNSVSLFRSCDGAATWQTIATGQARIGSYVWTIPLARSGDCRVRADVSGGGPTTTSGLFTIDSTPPGMVTGLSITPGNGQVALAWTNPTDPDFAGVRIYRTTNTGAATDLGTLVATIVAPTATWTDTGLVNGTDYGYHLATYDAAGNAEILGTEALDGRQSSNRSNGATITDGTSIWSIGGMVCSPGCPGTLFDEIWQYDTRYDTFIKKSAVLPTGRFGVRGAWDPGTSKVYLLGGRDGGGKLTAIQRYDPVADTAPTTVANLPQALTEGQAVYAPNTGKIYYFGGQNASGGPTHEIYAFDPATNAVTQPARLPTPRERAGAAYHAADGCIYVAGGKNGSVELDTIDRFCPATGAVTRLEARMTTGLHDVAVVDQGSRILLLGGRHDPSSSYYSTVEELTPASDRIVRSGQRLPTARSLYTSVHVGGTSYAMTLYTPITSPVAYRAPAGPMRAVPYSGTTISLTSPSTGNLVQGGGSTTISWTSDSSNAASVTLSWNCGGSAWTTIAAGLAASGSYTWNTVAKVTSSQCRVRAELSTLSSTSGFFTIDRTPPRQVAFPVAYAGNASNLLAWENPPDADFAGVRIYRTTTEGTLGSLIATITAGASPNDEYTDTGLTNGTRYIYTLAPYDTAGNARAWTATGDAALGPARFGAGVSGTATEGFMFGGCSGCTRLVEVWRYEPRLDRYTITTSLPTARERGVAAHVGGTINRTFVLGGQTDSAVTADVQSFDPVTGSMVSSGPLPAARTQGTGVYAPNTGKIYYFGGKSTSADTSATATVYAFDPTNGTSSDTGHALPTARFWAGGTYWPSDGCIYLFGGRNAAGADLADVVRYCPQSGSMTTLSTVLPSARREVVAYAGESEITIVGGTQGASTALSQIISFDPEATTMITHGTSLGTAAAFSGAALVDGTATMLGAYPTNGVATRLAPGSLVAATPTASPPNRSPLQAKHVSPADGTTVATATPTFTATYRDPDAGTGTLHFEVCTVPTAAKQSCAQAGGSIVASGTAAGVVDEANGAWAPTSLAEGTYYWHVRGEDASAAFGPWRPTWTVTVSLTSITLSVSSGTLPLGLVAPNENKAGTVTATVATTSAGGYELFATDLSDTTAASCACAATIADWTGTVATPTLWVSATSGHLGVTVLDAPGGRLSKWGTGTNTSETDFTNNLYAGLTTSQGMMHKRTSATVGDAVKVSFRTNPSATQDPGDYSGTVTLTAVAMP